MGLSSNSSSTVVKPLLLDNYFPFDPYVLPRTKHWVEPYYRVHEVESAGTKHCRITELHSFYANLDSSFKAKVSSGFSLYVKTYI